MTDYYIITRKEIIDVLTQDSHYRKTKKWPLLTSEDILPYIRGNDINIADCFDICKDIRGNKIETLKQFKVNIEFEFPFINEILYKFKGHLIACGGAIQNVIYANKSISDSLIKTDIDLFFYDLNVESANKMRLKIINKLIKKFKVFSHDIMITRNEKVTTIYIYNGNKLMYAYQLIHRIYPNVNSIIGGFDIGACMLAYDGTEIYATPLGVWSIINKSIIVDTKRRSTSYEHRLLKYWKRGYRIIFPGLDKNID